MNDHTQSTAQASRRIAGGRGWLIASVAGVAVSATGCGANDSENIGTSQAAFTVQACAEVGADETFTGKIDPALVTPRSYNNCYKGYVVDLENLDPAYTGEGNIRDARIRVAYADTPIPDRATCERTEVDAVFYEFATVGSVNFGVTGSDAVTTGWDFGWAPITLEERRGQWLFGKCDLSVQLTDLVAGKTYRVAATARTPSNATRKVSIGTYKPVGL